MGKAKQARKKTVRAIEEWAKRETPTVDAEAVEGLGQELGEWLTEYQPDDGEPNADAWGPLLNALWRLDCGLNPERRPFGHAGRDDGIRAAGGSHAMLHKWRRQADRLIALFGLYSTIGGDDVESVMAEARSTVAINGNELPRLRDGYSQIHPPAKWERVFDVCWKTILARIKKGQYDVLRIDEKNWRFRVADIPKSKREEVC